MRLRWSVALLVVVTASAGQAQMPSTTSVAAPGGAMVITALGHASVQIEQGGKVVIVDPVMWDGGSVPRPSRPISSS